MPDKDSIPATTAQTHLAEAKFVLSFLHRAVASDIKDKDMSPHTSGPEEAMSSQCTHRPTSHCAHRKDQRKATEVMLGWMGL